jgi:hypothetical protein
MMDTEMDPVRMEILEEELTQLKAQNATIMTQQAEILQKLRGLEATTILTPTPPTTTGTSDNKLKLAPLKDLMELDPKDTPSSPHATYMSTWSHTSLLMRRRQSFGRFRT